MLASSGVVYNDAHDKAPPDLSGCKWFSKNSLTGLIETIDLRP